MILFTGLGFGFIVVWFACLITFAVMFALCMFAARVCLLVVLCVAFRLLYVSFYLL